MKKLILGCSFFFAFGIAGAAYSNNGYWEALNPSKYPNDIAPHSKTSEYKVLKLSMKGISTELSKAGTTAEHGIEVELPNEDGSFSTFIVWETPMIEKGLQELLPEVKTFTGFEKGNHDRTAKIDFTSFGFRAAIFSSKETLLINPYYQGKESDYYVLFNQNNLKELSPVVCTVNNILSEIDLPQPSTLMSSRMNIKSVYRIAITTTGEYSHLVTGAESVNQTLEILISTMNRVNGVYERELAVSFNLIANNDQVIFTNPLSDPYTCNDDTDCLIDEAAVVLDNILNNANFDIGHIFCTEGGGLAALNSLCNEFTKGMGVSSSTGPDDYYVILHEIGHQLGANHSFSSPSGTCYGNGNPQTNYEPGSGSTIMSYAGNCAPDNIQNSADHYFNAFSLHEMTTHISGAGNCGVNTVINNSINFDSQELTYHVPIYTPYELTAPFAYGHHSEAAISYNWEQYETGNYGSNEANGSSATEGPIFKSQKPSESITRTYPHYSLINSNDYQGPGERLSNTVRTVSFKNTIRSIHQGLGSFKTSPEFTHVEVTSNAQFRVTSPHTNTTWNPGEVHNITWSPGGSLNAPVNSGYVSIYLSLDDGETYPFLIVSNAPNNGSYAYTVHDIGTSEGRIKVQGSGNVFFDVGKGRLTITGDPSNNINELLKQAPIIAYPNPTTDYLMIEKKEGIVGTIEISVYNILGQKVHEDILKENNYQLNTQGWANGHYIIQTTDGNGLQHQIKILKK